MQNNSAIAVIGLAYRAPGTGAKNMWEYLAEAKCAWSGVPPDRFDHGANHCNGFRKPGLLSATGAHFLPDDVYSFDAPFFNLRPDEARAMDPQHRMILECALEAMESAGIRLTDLSGTNTGVFSAVGSSDHVQQVSEDLSYTTKWTAIGNAACMFANRLSYFCNLTGPSITLDAACASSGYAFHMACQSIRSGECNAAFVAASHLILGPTLWSHLDNMGATSLEGKCFSYDEKASGFGRGEGGACLLVKRLDDAIRSGDPVLAVIRNTACNHSGRSDGITVPNAEMQEDLLRRVHEEAGLNPAQTPVVEGHGPGTPVGDPIEAGAFASVLARERTPSTPLYIGSVKSNFGHLEMASGIISIIKAILMVQHGQVLPTAHFEQLNKSIRGKEKLKVTKSLVPWPLGALKRVCVTNFGFGGSNVAIIVDESPNLLTPPRPEPAKGRDNGGLRLFVLSSKSEKSLSGYVSSFVKYLDTTPDSDDFLKHLSFTLGQRRTHHAHRLATVADSVSGLKDGLLSSKIRKIADISLAFVFTGQGAHLRYAQMSVDLQRYERFAATLDQAEACLCDLGAGWSLKEELNKPEAESRIHDAEISQPACTAVQLALVSLLQSWGVKPAAVMGHSSGEIAAAFAAGLISFQAAVAIAYFRGLAAARLRGVRGKAGAMLALGVGPDEASDLLRELDMHATIGAINSHQSVTISGDVSAIEMLHHIAQERGLFTRRLKVDIAYHSHHMEEVADFYLEGIQAYCPEDAGEYCSGGVESPPIFVSSVTGRVIETAAIDATYWVKNLLQPVLFRDAVIALYDILNRTRCARPTSKYSSAIIEIGPHATLKSPIQQTLQELQKLKSPNLAPCSYHSSILRGTSGSESLLRLLGNLFSMGTVLDFGQVNRVDIHDARVLTNLPAYEWDKSVRYVHKSRIMESKLHPGHDYDPLIGWKIPYCDGSEHKFRQVLTLDEMPWIRDHNVTKAVIFPMTGYLSMAIQALRRVIPTVPGSFILREYHNKRSLEIAEDERIDLTTCLRPAATGTENFSSSSWTFEILSWAPGIDWTQHCYGFIEATTDQIAMNTSTLISSAKRIGSDTLQERDAERLYDLHGTDGTTYGPAFRKISRFWESASWTVSEITLDDTKPFLPTQYDSSLVVDPVFLDTCLQGMGPFRTINEKRAAYVPNYVSRLRVSNKLPASLAKPPVITSVTRLLSREAKVGNLDVSVAVFAQCSPGVLVPVAEFESVSFQSVTVASIQDEVASLPSSYCWETVPVLDFVGKEVSKVISSDPLSEHEYAERAKFNSAALYYMDRTLNEMEGQELPILPPHLAKFHLWAKTIIGQEKSAVRHQPVEILADVADCDAQGQLICRVGEHLPRILRGEVQPLEIMLTDDLLSRFYEEHKGYARGNRILARFARHLSDIKMGMRVLEIGGGTGAATLPVMEELSQGGDSLPEYLSYTFTDVSAGLFEKAKKKLSRWTKQVAFKRLDITQDPTQQGFTLESFDLVISSNVLHATPNIAVAIRHIRSLLKPNGKLLLLEATCHPPQYLPFALLPGWWPFEDEHRPGNDGPMISETAWHHLLVAQGFSGVDSSMVESKDPADGVLTVMCSTRVNTNNDDDGAPTSIYVREVDDVGFVNTVAGHVAMELQRRVAVKTFGELRAADGELCIVLDSPDQSILTDLSPGLFQTLKEALLETSRLLWVIPEGHHPDAQAIKGILRTVRLETDIRALLLFENVPPTEEGAKRVAQVAKRLQDSELGRNHDQDFVWENDMICIPRLRQLAGARESYASETGIPLLKLQSFWQADRTVAMTVDTVGSLDSIYFGRTATHSLPLADNDIIIRVEAAGVNFRDLLLVLGSIPWMNPGFEGAGVVVHVGSGVANLCPGDRVLYSCLEGGGFSNHVRIPAWAAARIPDELSSVDAAGLPVAYITAIMAIMRIGRLRKEESVLIHAASGAVGQACIALAQNIGARVFVTAGSAEKREFLRQRFGIPMDYIFSSRTSAFRDAILCKTDRKGVNVVINSSSGHLLQATWELMADFGRFVEIGKVDLLKNSYLPLRPFERCVSFTSIDLRQQFTKQPKEMAECFSILIDLLQRQIVVPIRPVNIIPISHIADGLRKLQSGKNIGKIVASLGPDDCVLAESTPSRSLSTTGRLLRSDVTYLITGGTGGIGISLAQWMVENGACNVILLGRSGSSRTEVKQLLALYTGTDINVKALSCDVGAREDLERVLRSVQSLPPIHGVIHGAMHLRDSLLQNATYEDWHEIRMPRVQGAWNLHELLPKLDFFIILSSYGGATGNVGQSIYAGTSTFFDAFSTYRNSHGQHTVSVSLPLVLDVGYAVKQGLTEDLKAALGATLTEAHLRTLIKGAIIGPSSSLNAGGKAMSFTLASGDDASQQSWQLFHPRDLVQRTNSKMLVPGFENLLGKRVDGSHNHDPLLHLLEHLLDKVSSITMIERDEVHADAPLRNYGLDSLISVELRNWIRRQTKVELPLPRIVGAKNLRTLAQNILAQKEPQN
ncbi:polyketide synthase [Beauveria bassiana ARSEF 2860]|uniref:Polyketide synthase n=1 Tax=Beauveria bassiana (strain ARSEF 2860) TaxID=655819 RepID=J5J9J1_BEAB2|nr:polyketide synthase [Beauveria bassiana ARSEF 2860]EJP60751.1 polyketide synthase [Beauveria bassiana ARSEF 2860]